ncbi:hypothetical protein HOC80_01995 [archaeon]|jgi:hypothetical protein|nr:hypothetical protein [archaeon]MBT4416854.1 hypothetical protein [archaeon]
MKKNKQALIGAGALILGFVGGNYFLGDYSSQFNSLCTPLIFNATRLKERQYRRLKSSSYCIDDLSIMDSPETFTQVYEECINRALEGITKIDEEYEEYLRENNISDAQVTECDEFRRGYPYLFGSIVGAVSFCSIIGGLGILVGAYRRRRET